MKKFISLSMGVLVSIVMFAQDTIPTSSNKNTPGSNMLDTLPKGDKWSKDSMSVNRKDKWSDTSSMSRKWEDSSMTRNSNPDTTAGNKSWNNSNPNTNRPDTSMSTNSMNNNNTGMNRPDTSMGNMDKRMDSNSNNQNAMNNAAKNYDSSANKNVVTEKDNMKDTRVTGDKESNQGLQSDSTSMTKTKMEDRVIMMDDKMMIIKNGDSSLLDEDITLKSGAIVTKDGNVKYKNGTTTVLKNGQYINLNPAGKNKSNKNPGKKKVGAK